MIAEKCRPSIGFSVVRLTSGLALRRNETMSGSPRDAAIISAVSPCSGCLESTWVVDLESQLDTVARSLDTIAARTRVERTESQRDRRSVFTTAVARDTTAQYIMVPLISQGRLRLRASNLQCAVPKGCWSSFLHRVQREAKRTSFMQTSSRDPLQRSRLLVASRGVTRVQYRVSSVCCGRSVGNYHVELLEFR